jgi:hypothetical protein
MDHHVRSVVTSALRQRGVDVLTAAEDGTSRLQDPLLLSRSTALGRVLFTQDDDLLAEGTRRLRSGESFAGVIYTKQQRLSDREVVEELELIAGASDPSEWANRIDYLPLKR